MLADRPLVALTVAFVLGIVAALSAPPLVWCAMAATLFALILYALTRRALWLSLLLFAASACLGALRYTVAVLVPPAALSRLAPAVVTLQGVVQSEVRIALTQRFSLAEAHGSCLFAAQQVTLDRADGTSRQRPVSGTLELRLPLGPATRPGDVTAATPQRGDRLTVHGLLERPPGQRNPGGFDYRAWLDRRGVETILSVRRRQDWRRIREERDPGGRMLNAVRGALLAHLRATLPAERAGVLEGLLIGDREDLPPELETAFQRTGAFHLLATAGLQVGLLTVLLQMLWRMVRVPRYAGLLLTVGLLIGYAVLVGGRPSVVRAVVVAAIVLLGVALEREPDLPNALALAALGLLLYEPRFLGDAGFQISFCTVITLSLLWPLVRSTFQAIGVRWSETARYPAPTKAVHRVVQLLATVFLMAVAAQIGSAPLIAYYDNALSPIAPLVNMQAVPAAPPLLVCGFAGTFGGALSPALAHPLDLAANALLGYLISLIHTGSALPGAGLSVVSPPIGLIVCYYALVWGLSWWLIQSPKSKIQNSRALLTLLLLFAVGHLALYGWSWSRRHHDGTLRVTFLDVGQGDAAVLETPGGRVIVVDTGGVGTGTGDDEGRRVVGPFLRHLGCNRIDALILTHPHADHIGGASTLLRDFPVSLLLDNGQHPSEPEVTRVLASAREQGVPIKVARRGQRIDCGDGVTLQVLGPTDREAQGTENNASVATRIEYGRTHLLLTGDAEAEEEVDLLQSGQSLACDVLKTGHHGSRTSTTPDFLAAAQPRYAVISVGEHNLYGHPNNEVITRLQQRAVALYRTDRNGAITVVSDGASVHSQALIGTH